jgi:hypothetical protein
MKSGSSSEGPFVTLLESLISLEHQNGPSTSICGVPAQTCDSRGVPSATMQSNISKADRALEPHGLRVIVEGGPAKGCYHVRIVTSTVRSRVVSRTI